MIFELKMMNGDIYEITVEEKDYLKRFSGLVEISRLDLIVNSSSIVSISPKGLAKTKENLNEISCKDGTIAVKHFGEWFDKYSRAKLNIAYYPELKQFDDSRKIIDEAHKQIGNL